MAVEAFVPHLSSVYRVCSAYLFPLFFIFHFFFLCFSNIVLLQNIIWMEINYMCLFVFSYLFITDEHAWHMISGGGNAGKLLQSYNTLFLFIYYKTLSTPNNFTRLAIGVQVHNV